MKENVGVRDTEATAEEAALVDQFAAFAKAYFIYPANNARVQDSLIQFLETFRGFSKELKALEILVRRDHLRSSSGRLDTRKPVLGWLRESMMATGLDGVRLDSLMSEEGLLDFMDRLQENRALREREKHKDFKFKEFWPEIYPGIRLWERSYLGGYHNRTMQPSTRDGEGGVATVRGALDGPDPEGVTLESGIKVSRAVLDKVTRVERILASKGMDNAPEMSMNLLAEVMNHLPAEALSNPAYGESKLEEIMEEVERLVAGLVMRSAPSEEQKVKRLLATVVRRFFGSSYTGDGPVKSPTVSLGRPGDELIDDDLEAFLADLEKLPQTDLNLDEKDSVADSEALGACLFRLTYCPREASARTIYDKLEQLLINPDEECQKIMATYADLLLAADTDSATRAETESVFEHLRTSNLLRKVRDQNCLKVDSLAFAFPVAFLLFLDSIDERKESECQELQDLCQRVGDERIRREERNLTANKGILKPSRAGKILSCMSRDVLPLVRIIARNGDRSLRPRLVAYLARLGIDRPEVAALRVVEPADRIPKGYLIDLCDGELDFGTYKPNVREYAGFLIRNYIADLPEEDAYLERRVFAIKSLVEFPGQETRETLKDQAKGRGPLGLIRPAKMIRDAVAEVQAKLGAGR